MSNPWHSLIFGFDPGTKFGWSVFVNGELVASGTFLTFRSGDHIGLRYSNLVSFLTELFHLYVIDPLDTLVGYEDIDFNIFKSKDNLRVYAGLVAIMEMVCANFGLKEIRGVNPTTLKKHSTGDEKATKQQMLLEAISRFDIRAQSDDHADACLIGAYFKDFPCPTMEPAVQTRFANKQKKRERKARKAAKTAAALPKFTPSSPITLPPIPSPKKRATRQPRSLKLVKS
jgi:Holliday junction resolvasome RuvABC endonuclease subunit